MSAQHTPGRKCGFCQAPAPMTIDSAEKRQYTCQSCGAIETISKGTSWWYHGWKRPDGAHLRAPTVEEMHAGKYGWQTERAAIAKATGQKGGA